MAHCLIGLGANLGCREQTLARAIDAIARLPASALVASSRFLETAPVGGPADQPPFLNAAVRVSTELAPRQVLVELQRIERQLGRVRSERWGPRTIDLDLLLYDGQVLSSPELTLPHPRMAFRRFVLDAAAEIAPDMVHPTIGWTLAALRDHLSGAFPYVAVVGVPAEHAVRLAAALAARLGGTLLSDPLLRAWRPAEADSSGRCELTSIEWRDRCRQWLRADRWRDRRELVISDFWCDNAAQGTGSAVPVAGDATATQDELLQPKLLIVVDARRGAEGASPPSGAGADPSCEAATDGLLARATRTGLGPVCVLHGDDLAAQVAECAAAIEAMR